MRLLRQSLTRAIDLALPPRCAGCGAVTTEPHRFCANCWSTLRFLGPPWCARCHLPFDYERGSDVECGTCLASPPRHAGINAAVAYGDVSRKLALQLKYGGHLALAETMARHMVRRLPDNADLLVPVPLHRWRLWRRGFNQAALMARTIGRMGTIPVDIDVLERHRRTIVLRELSGRQRMRAVAGAFRVAKDRRRRVAGRNVVLVDDIYTSGATANACVGTLLGAGAATVSILCWARVLESEDD